MHIIVSYFVFEKQMSRLDIYTDGSALRNSQESPAGAAFYIPSMNILRSKSFIGTNNMAELIAMDYALWYCIENKLNNILIHSDSQYSINAVTGTNKAKANTKLIERIQLKLQQIDTHFEYVRGHKGIVENEIVDKAARKAALKKKEELKK